MSATAAASLLDDALGGDVRAAAAGDRAAYGRLVDDTRNLVCSISLAIVRDVAASEDVAQEVYLAAWQRLGQLRNPASFLPWLRQLTRNRANDHLRGQLRGRGRGDDEAALAALADPRPDAGVQLLDRERQAALAAALAELPDEAREVVTLFYREGRSTLQVARLLGLNDAAVKKRLQRAREQLRAATLARLGDSLHDSAPAAAFTATVLAALVTGAPATAAAAKVGLAASAGSVGSKLTTGLAAGAAGPILGLLGVLGGVWLIARRARDEAERQALRRFAAVNSVAILLTALLLPASARLLHGGGMVLWFVLCWCLFAYNYLVWLPRITARREALERAEDPRLAVCQRRGRERRLLGLIAGGLCGGAGVAWMLWRMHHGG